MRTGPALGCFTTGRCFDGGDESLCEGGAEEQLTNCVGSLRYPLHVLPDSIHLLQVGRLRSHWMVFSPAGFHSCDAADIWEALSYLYLSLLAVDAALGSGDARHGS